MVIAEGQFAKLHIKAVFAGIVFARRAPAVAAPIPKGHQNPVQNGVIGDYGAALAHRYMVGGIEAEGAYMPESTRMFAAEFGAQGVAVVLNEPKALVLADLFYLFQIERIAQSMRDENRLGFW